MVILIKSRSGQVRSREGSNNDMQESKSCRALNTFKFARDPYHFPATPRGCHIFLINTQR